jgi:hypothetical protein
MGKETGSAIMRVVARYESSWTTSSVILSEYTAAVAGAFNEWVVLSWATVIYANSALRQSMMSDGWHHLDILFAVVAFLAVDMVDLLALGKSASDLCFSHKTMLINIAANIGKMMAGHPQNHIPIRSNRSTAAPIRILFPWIYNSHVFRVALSQPAFQAGW